VIKITDVQLCRVVFALHIQDFRQFLFGAFQIAPQRMHDAEVANSHLRFRIIASEFILQNVQRLGQDTIRLGQIATVGQDDTEIDLGSGQRKIFVAEYAPLRGRRLQPRAASAAFPCMLPMPDMCSTTSSGPT